MRDEVDELVEAWARERPDLDVAPVEVFSRIGRLARHLDLARRDAFTAAHPDFVPLNAAEALAAAGVENAADLVTPAGHLRLWPHKHATDGFFAARWIRRE